MSAWKAKRFWKSATPSQTDAGFEVLLDDRRLKTPAKADLVVPSLAMAQAIAQEWDAQTEVIDPNKMPVTRSANAAIDKVTPQQAEVAEMLAAYGDSDLLCYRAESPKELVQRQADAWDPLLEWADAALGARLLPRVGVIHEPQSPAAIAALRKRTDTLNPFELAAFHDLVSLSGSLIIGFAAVEDAQAINALWDASRIDEDMQRELWGADEEADALAKLKLDAFLHAKRFLELLDGKN